MKRPMSLWSIMAAITTLATVLSLLVAGTLVYLATILHKTTVVASAAAENVRIAETARIELMRWERFGHEEARRSIEASLTGHLADAHKYASTAEEASILKEAERLVEAYLAARGDVDEMSARRADAYTGLDALVAINLDQSAEALREAAAWDAFGTSLGMGMGVLVVLGAAARLLWVRNSVIHPILTLARAMERFAGGDPRARSGERGPAEIREMSRRFNEMAAALAEQARIRIAFLGGVAHDLRNPLAAMRNSMTLIEQERALTADQRRQVIDRMARQVAGMERLLGDFLDMARVEAGEMELRIETSDLRTILEHAVETSAGILVGHDLRLRLPENPLGVRCDPLRIQQVVTNLVSNAAKYSPAGSRIEVAARRENDHVVIEVVDQGMGIPEEERRHIFEPFRRVDSSRQKVAGMGLGLFVVRRIVEAHGGVIEVRNRPAQGSVFSVSLPMDGTIDAGRSHDDEAAPAAEKGRAGAGGVG